ncbi:MAG: sugar ABC transporter permease [Acidobacteriota bacterium]
MSREARAAFLFLAPALGAMLVFFFLPVAAALLLSLPDFDIYALADPANARFVGLGNFARLLGDPVFWKALSNTTVFVVVCGPLTLLVALFAALLVNSKLTRFKGVFRTAYFAPVVTTLVAVATVWRYLYHPTFGLLNRFLGALGLAPIDWLGDPRWALASIILLSVWKNFGYDVIVLVAGLNSIPDSLYEAARLDGAGFWTQLRHVTLPMLLPSLFFCAVITTIGYFQIFAEPYVMTNAGGPLNATLTMVLLMYKQGFRWWSMGYASAVAFVLCAVILAVTAVMNRFQRRGEA